MAKQSIASMNNQDNFIDNHLRAYTNNRVFFTFFLEKSFFQIKTLRNRHEFVNKGREGISWHVCDKFHHHFSHCKPVYKLKN